MPAANLSLQTIITHSISYLGGCGSKALPALLQYCGKEMQHHPTQKFHLLIFAADDNADAPAQHWQTLQTLLQNMQPATLIAELLQLTILPISGCQRLALERGRITIDLYLSCNTHTLKDIVVPATWISQWFWHTSFLPEMALVWQLARLSQDHCVIRLSEPDTTLKQHFVTAGFQYFHGDKEVTTKLAADDIAISERQALRHQALAQLLPFPRYCWQPLARDQQVAIIGAGIAGASLALSLAERGMRTHVFCSDQAAGDSASGNRQGALYPLLTPEADPLNTFFQKGFLFSRQRIIQLAQMGMDVPHDFCGVLVTGFDARSRARLRKIAEGQPWPTQLLQWLSTEAANAQAGVDVNEAGIYYPLGGWVNPKKLTQASLQQAQELGFANLTFDSEICKLMPNNAGQWMLTDKHDICYGPFTAVVVASGSNMAQFSQTAELQATPFRGQVSEVPTQAGLAKIKTVLCAKGYLTPAWQNTHCLGASYIKDPQTLAYSEIEQQENLEKIQQSYADAEWPFGINVGSQARVGVRMVTRDHLPMASVVPDVKLIQSLAIKQANDINFWRETAAPIHNGLYVLGALGSRGLCSGPLAAEMLAAELTHQPLPLSLSELERLSANRMWLRKLLKGKTL